MTIVRQVTSRHNDLFKDLRRLLAEPTAYRKLGRVWVEGEEHKARTVIVATGASARWLGLPGEQRRSPSQHPERRLQ